MEPSQHNTRKRVRKACANCRTKKSKCDGDHPCGRCKRDNTACIFDKKSKEKVHPQGYVGLLEKQNTQLAAGVRELYRLLLSGQGWHGEPLPEAQDGYPLVPDILKGLNVSQPTSETSSSCEGFEEDGSHVLMHNALDSLWRGEPLGASSMGSKSLPLRYDPAPTNIHWTGPMYDWNDLLMSDAMALDPISMDASWTNSIMPGLDDTYDTNCNNFVNPVTTGVANQSTRLQY